MRVLILIICLVFSFYVFATDPRTSEAYTDWKRSEGVSTRAFEQYLVSKELDHLVPMNQLLRSASDWEKCKAQPFSLPPGSHWSHVESVLKLVRHLKQSNVLTEFEVHSGYRDPKLNDCAKGAKSSAHMRTFALDLTSSDGSSTAAALCEFWKAEGEKWNMGLSRYKSGRIHIDTSGYRTWGHTGKYESSYCKW
jgi:uncharacterized protein YcbK (DUF882 family)